MANGNKTPEEIAEAAAREAARETKVREENKHLEKQNGLLVAANRAKERALREARMGPNLTQLLIATSVGIGGTIAGYKLNRILRTKTAEWEWVNEEGERSIGAVLLADIAPPVVGLIGAGLTAYFATNGLLAAGLIGLFMGIAGGSLASTIQGDPE